MNSSLHPIDYCLYSIKHEFLNFVESTSFFDQINISNLDIHEKDRNTKETFHCEHLRALNSSTLDSFFPFDPCLLQQLNLFNEKYYRNWKDKQNIPIQSSVDTDNNFATEEEASQASATSCTSLSYLRKDYSSSMMSVAMSHDKNVNPECASSHSVYESININPSFRRPRQYSIGSTGSW